MFILKINSVYFSFHVFTNIHQFILDAQRQKKVYKEKMDLHKERWMKSLIMQKQVTHSWTNILCRFLGYIIVSNIWRFCIFCWVSILSASSFKVCCLLHNSVIYNSNNIIIRTAYTSVLSHKNQTLAAAWLDSRTFLFLHIAFILYFLFYL